MICNWEHHFSRVSCAISLTRFFFLPHSDQLPFSMIPYLLLCIVLPYCNCLYIYAPLLFKFLMQIISVSLQNQVLLCYVKHPLLCILINTFTWFSDVCVYACILSSSHCQYQLIPLQILTGISFCCLSIILAYFVWEADVLLRSIFCQYSSMFIYI